MLERSSMDRRVLDRTLDFASFSPSQLFLCANIEGRSRLLGQL